MAIARVTSSSVSGLSTGGTLAINCTGADLLVVFVHGAGSTIAQITGLTYNGVAMTRAVGVDETYLTGGNTSQALWYLAAPSSGSNNVTITITGGGFADMGAVCYSGTKQTGIPDASSSFNTNTTATSKAQSVTSVAANCWLILGASTSNGGMAASTGATLVQDVNSGFRELYDSNGAVAAGANSMTYTYTSGSTGNVMMSIAPAVAAGPTNLKSLDTNLKANIKSYNTNVLANIKSIDTNS